MNRNFENSIKSQEYELFCLEHPKLKPDFFCLGSKCPYLMLCHECTLHNLDHAKAHINLMKPCEELWEILHKNFSNRDILKENAIINQINKKINEFEKILEEGFLVLEDKIEKILRDFKENMRIKMKLNTKNLVFEEKPLTYKPINFLKYLKEKASNIEDQKKIIKSIYEKYGENASQNISENRHILEYLEKKYIEVKENTSEYIKSDNLLESLKKELFLFESFYSFREWNKPDSYLNTSLNIQSFVTERLEKESESLNLDTIPSFFNRYHKANSLDCNALDVFGKVTLIQTIDCGHLKQEKLNEGVIISQVSLIEINNHIKIFTCSKDKTIGIFDFSSFKLEKILEGHTDWVYRFLYYADSKSLISGGIDKTIRLWDLKSKDYRCVKVLNCESSIISLVKLDFESFAFAMRINGLKVMDLNFNVLAQYTFNQDKEIWNIYPLNKDSHIYLFLGLVDGSIGILSLQKNIQSLTLVNIIKDCHCSIIFDIISYQLEEKYYLISCSGDSLIKIWGLNIGVIDMKLNLIKTLKGHEGFIRKIMIYKENLLVSCSDDASLKFWQLPEGKLIQTIKKAHGLAIYWLEKFNDEIILTVGEDNLSVVKFWQ